MSADQNSAALKFPQVVVVEASAGSGKTRALAKRYLKLLLNPQVSPQELSLRNILAITTDTTSALTEALGVQDIKDYVKKYWREGLWAVYRNRKINPKLIRQIRTSSKNILDYLISEDIIAQWRNVSVTQDSTEPRQVNVTAQVQPAFGLQWMDITFTFVLSFSS